MVTKEIWVEEPSGNLLIILKDGTYNHPPKISKGTPLFAYENTFNGITGFAKSTSHISEKDYNELHKTYEILPNDLLLTVVGTIGRTPLIQNEPKFFVQRSVTVLRTNKRDLARFLHYVIQNQTYQTQLQTGKNATSQSGDLFRLFVKNYSFSLKNDYSSRKNSVNFFESYYIDRIYTEYD